VKTMRRFAAALALLLLTAAPARASILGSIFSGPTTGDPAAVYWNPGAMPLMEGTQAILFGGLSAIRLQYARALPSAHDGSAFPTAEVFVAKPAATVGLVTDLGGMLGDLRIGLGATIPVIDGASWKETYEGRPSSTRYYAINARQVVFQISPSVGYRLNKYVSFGVGLDVIGMMLHHEAMVDFGAKINQMACAMTGGTCSLDSPMPREDPTYDARAVIDGMGWGVGAFAGVLVTPTPWMRMGLGFHSGGGTVTIPVDMTVTLPTAVTDYMAQSMPSVKLPPIEASGKVKTGSPWMVMAGVSFNPTQTLELAVDLHWIDQSETSTMVADVLRTSSTLVGDQVLVKQRDDVFLVGLRTQYRLLRSLATALRLEYENNTRPERFTTPVSIDYHKLSFHVGLAWQVARWLVLTLEYGHFFLLPRDVGESEFYPRSQAISPVEQGFDKPSPTGRYTGVADRVGLGIVVGY